MALTINDVAPTRTYTASASQTVFAVPFNFFSDDDLVVLRNGSPLALSGSPASVAEYSVTGAGSDSGGSITLGGGATSGDIIVIYRDIPIERTADYPLAGPFNIESLNTELAKNAAMSQQLERDVNRSLKAPYGEDGTIIPSVATRANKVLGFDGSGEAMIYDTPVESIAAADAAAAAALASETNAATSEVNAAASEANAATSETNAAASEAAAAALVADGNKGDVTVASGGTAWTVPDLNLKFDKLGGTVTGSINATDFLQVNGGPKLKDAGASNALTVETNSGYFVNIGPQNSLYAHFTTDRPAYHFDKPIEIVGKAVAKQEELAGIRASRYGVVGDGTTSDQAAILTAANAAVAAGLPLVFDGTKTYNLTGQLAFPSGIKVRTNGAVFKCSGSASTTPIVTVAGNSEFDELRVNIASGITRQRAVLVDGANTPVRIGSIEVTAVAQQGYVSTATDYGVRLYRLSNGSHIGRVKVDKYDLPAWIDTCTDTMVGYADITSYSRGLRITDALRVHVIGGYVRTRSANAVSMTAGWNGVLLSKESGTLANVTISDFVVENAAEHSFRLGGGPSYDVSFVRCVARSGDGTGFKALGTDNAAPIGGEYHRGVRYVDCVVEDCASGGGAATNLCGFLVERSTNVQIIRPIVRKNVEADAGHYGIHLYGVTDVQITDPRISEVANYGVYVPQNKTAAPAASVRVLISGGVIKLCQEGIWFTADGGLVHSKCRVENVLLDSNTNRGFVGVASGGGTFQNCYFSGQMVANGLGAMTLTAAGWRLDCSGDPTQGSGGYVLADFLAEDGSQWSFGKHYHRRFSAWRATDEHIVLEQGNANLTIDASHDKTHIVLNNGGSAKTLTLGSVGYPVVFSFRNKGASGWSFSAPNGLYLDGDTTAYVAPLSFAPGSAGRLVHEGGGVWSFIGTRL